MALRYPEPSVGCGSSQFVKTSVEKRSIKRSRSPWVLLGELLAPRWRTLVASFFLLVINRLSGLVMPFAPRLLIDDVIVKGRHEKLLPIVLVIVAATVIQGLSVFATARLLTKLGNRLVVELRQKLQRHIGLLPLSFYETNKVGALVSRVMSDLDGIHNLVGEGAIELLGGLTTTVVAIVVLFFINSTMTMIVLSFVLGFAYLAKYRLGRVLPLFRERSRMNAEVTGRLAESLGGIRVVKSYRAEVRESAAIAVRLNRLLNTTMATVNMNSLINLAAIVLMGLLGAALWFVGATNVVRGTLSVGQLMTFVAVLGCLVSPVREAVTIGAQLTEAYGGLQRANELLGEVLEQEDPMRTVSLGPISGAIAFENVYFSYEAGKSVLRDVTFHAAPGTITALVGPSGAGKSTITNLLAAFYKPDDGTILVDGKDLSRAKLDTYRSQLGMVLQESFLFDGTIAENVAFSRPSATAEEVIEACRIAHVSEFAERLEHKYETVVGERGVKLSGGQRQRVSIARAILANPRFLILDEATSSLDSESEELIQEGLKLLMKNRTTVVIAHRLSTIRQADQILVIENGEIVERGVHESLCLLGMRYWKLYSRQRDMDGDLLSLEEPTAQSMTQK